MRMNTRLAIGIAAGVWIALAGCSRSDESVPPERPNIVLITLDTLRADHLGCYGYPRNTSPAIDRFAAQATLYKSARTTAPWTLPSHASMFTGLYPFQHGARTYRLSDRELPAAEGDTTTIHHNAKGLASEFETLAERLALAGYQTAAVMANTIYLKKRYGLSQGFDSYDLKRGPASAINQRVLAWLDARDRARPFFLFINYMDTHSPYNALPRPSLVTPTAAHDTRLERRIGENILRNDGELQPGQLQLVVDWYDLAVAYLDEQIGNLFERMKHDGLFDDTLIIVASDHGEYFGEKHLSGHSKDVYEPAMAVPLIVKAPGQETGGVEERLVSLVHVPALVAAHTLAIDADALPRSWPEPFVIGENHYSRLKDLISPYAHRFERSRIALYRGSDKYIHSTDGENELYDLTTDANENSNLLASEPQRAAALGLLLRETLGAQLGLDSIGDGALDAQDKELTPDEVEQLEELGYL